jgi:hypothetical protein
LEHRTNKCTLSLCRAARRERAVKVSQSFLLPACSVEAGPETLLTSAPKHEASAHPFWFGLPEQGIGPGDGGLGRHPTLTPGMGISGNAATFFSYFSSSSHLWGLKSHPELQPKTQAALANFIQWQRCVSVYNI